MTVIQPRRTRRTHSEAFKQSLIEACGEPGASVAGVALTNGINANQLRRWMRERGIEPPELSCLPLRVAASEPMAGFVPVQLSPHVDPPIRLERKRPATPSPPGSPNSVFVSTPNDVDTNTLQFLLNSASAYACPAVGQ